MDDQEGGLGQRTRTQTPLPRRQIRTLLLLDLAEVISATIVYPFIVIKESKVTQDKFNVGHYVGIVESLYFLTQAVLVPQWGHLSDRIGRKPVLVIGTLGLTFSMRHFGLSKSFLGITFSRALVAGSNGNSNVVKSAIRELTDKSNRAGAFSFLPFVWFVGYTVAPLLGGSLCYPSGLFFYDAFWQEHPLHLSFMMPVAFSLFCCILALFTLHETNPRLRNSRYQPPLHSGDSDVALLSVRGDQVNGTLPRSVEPADKSNLSISPTTFSFLRFLLNDPVRLALLNYGLLAFLDAAFRVLLPLFLATSIDASPLFIGNTLANIGLVGFIIQVVVFAPLHRLLGSRSLYSLGLCSFGILFATLPFIKNDPGVHYLSSSGSALIALQMALYPIARMPFHIISSYVEDPSVSNPPMRAMDGIAQTVIPITRAFGSASAASLFSLSMQRQGLIGGNLVYYVLGSVTALAVGVSRIPLVELFQGEVEGEQTHLPEDPA